MTRLELREAPLAGTQICRARRRKHPPFPPWTRPGPSRGSPRAGTRALSRPRGGSIHSRSVSSARRNRKYSSIGDSSVERPRMMMLSSVAMFDRTDMTCQQWRWKYPILSTSRPVHRRPLASVRVVVSYAALAAAFTLASSQSCASTGVSNFRRAVCRSCGRPLLRQLALRPDPLGPAATGLVSPLFEAACDRRTAPA